MNYFFLNIFLKPFKRIFQEYSRNIFQKLKKQVGVVRVIPFAPPSTLWAP
jgi:hypothetical protein